MSFEWPTALMALAIVPLLVFGYYLLDASRSRQAARFSTPALLPNVIAGAPGRLRHLPAAVLLVAVVALLVGVARPHAILSVPREEATVMLVIDVSRSMTAKDVKPSRLDAAQLAARRFLEQIPDSFRVGVVTFATRARVIAPPSNDRNLPPAALDTIRAGEGTALGEAVILALRAARSVPGADSPQPPPASILLISDGAQTQGQVLPAQAAQQARRQRTPVFTIVLGTPNGIVERELTGGFTEQIRVPPDPETLREVARVSGGEFFTAAGAEQLGRVYEELGSRLGKQDKRTEVTVAFAGAGMVLLLLGGGLSALLFRRLP